MLQNKARKLVLLTVFIGNYLLLITKSFNFKQIIVYPNTYIVGQSAEYSIQMHRYEDNSFNPTSWNSQAVAQSAQIKIIFPSDYPTASLSGITLLSVSVNSIAVTASISSISGLTITIINAFTSLTGSNLFVSVVYITLNNVINPIPAVYTGQFQGQIGTDVSQPNNGGIQLQPAAMQSCTITFNPAFVNKTSAMIVTINPTNSMDSTSSIQIALPSIRRWVNNINTAATIPIVQGSMACTGQSGAISATPVCTGDLSTFKISAANIFASGITTVDSFSLSIGQLTSPPTLQPSDLITINSYLNGNPLETCTAYPSGLVANPINSVVISSNQLMEVNHQVGLRISINISDFMDTKDNIRVVFPVGLTIQYVNISGTGPFDTALHSVTGQTLNVGLRSSVTRLFSPAQQFIINFYNFTAPPSTLTTSAITVSVIRNSYAKMIGTATVQAQPASITGSILALTKTVWAVTSYKINITLDDSLTSAGYIQIYFPSTITPTLANSCATLIGTGVVSSPTCEYNSVLHLIKISNMVSGSTAISPQTLQLTILNVRNAPSINPSASFTINSYYTALSNSLVATGTISGITATVGAIQSSTALINPSSNVVYQSSVTYIFSFVNTYLIPQGGFVLLVIPNDVTLTVGSITNQCKVSRNSGAFGATTCTAQTLASTYLVNFTNVATSSNIAAATNISLRIDSQIRNPADTGIVSGFTLQSFYSDGYLIQQLLTGLSVQTSTPSAMQGNGITSSSVKNSETPIIYTFAFSQLPPLTASSKILITFPSTLKLTSASTSTCTDLANSPLTCTYSTVGSTHVLTVTLSASSVSSLAQFGIKVGGMRNLPSFAPFTSPFIFVTKSNSQLVSYASGSFTPAFQNTITSAFQSISGQFGSRILGQSSTLQITLTPSGYIIPSYIQVNIASTFSIASALTCTSAICTYNPAISHQIRVTGINSIAQMVFTVSGFTAPNSAPSDTTMVTSYDSGGYKIDQDSTIILTIACTLPCRTCNIATPTVCLSCYQNTAISTFNYYHDPLDLCYQTCPSDTYPNIATFKCLACDANCLQCSTIATNCTKCNSAGTVPYLNKTGNDGQCVSNCGVYHYPNTAQIPIACVVCSNINSLCLRCTNLGVCSACKNKTQTDGSITVGYFSSNQCYSNPSNCPNSITIPNPSLNLCQSCDAVCLTCSLDKSNCTSCAVGTAQHLGSCVSACPSPLVIKNGACQSCSTICLACSITYNNCTSCDTATANKYLYNFNCLTQCPQLYYEDTVLGLCPSCASLNINCVNCTTSSTCGTCDANFVFHTVDSKCYAVAPTGYINISGIAVQCDSASDCSTCSVTIYNCTACRTRLLQGNDCVLTCSAGFVPVNGICSACTSNCSTCVNLRSNCTSCLDTIVPEVFLTNYQCIQTCPDFTYPNSNTNICENCGSPCQKCTSLTSCVTCRQNFFLQDIVNCVVTCRNGYLGISRLCTRCTSPCDFCSGTLTHCTKCLDGFYFVSATNRCVNPCPTGLYPNNAGQCSGCTSPCNTCQNTAQNCTSCLNNLLLLSNQCLTTCPDAYYPLNGQCLTCAIGCATCSSATVCLTCSISYSLYISNCLTSCPTSHPVINNGVCAKCTDTNCLVCDSLDQCSSCKFPTLLHIGTCLTACPTNYTANATHCNYDPVIPTPTDNTTTVVPQVNQTLNTTLSTDNIFPVPFTIGGTFIGIACLMSKFQHSYTFLAGALYSLLSILEWGSWGVALYLYFARVSSEFTIGITYIEALVFLGAVAFLYFINILALIVQNCFLRKDPVFVKWQKRQPTNFCWYCSASIIGLLVTHKFKNVIFCKLFGFEAFKANLQNVQNFRVFNIFSFLSFISSAGILIATSLMIKNYHIVGQQLMAYIDVLVLTVACIILAILTSIKNSSFFSEKDEDGYIVNKRINASQTLMNEAIVPMMQETDLQTGGNINRNIFDTQRKFRDQSSDSYTQSEQQATPSIPMSKYAISQMSRHSKYSISSISRHSKSSISSEQSQKTAPPPLLPPPPPPPPTIQFQQISIQAAPMLQDYSKIDFYNDRSMSQFTVFQKHDQSVNVSHRPISRHQVSVQHQPQNLFNKQQKSIQNNPLQQDISIQKQVEHADISMQHVPKYDDAGQQMSRQQAQYSIQAAVNYNNASVQYSAKPVFENISKDFDDGSQNEQQIYATSNMQQSDNQQNNENNKDNESEIQQKPAQNERGLKPELQLDVDEKIRQKQQELQMIKQQQKQKDKDNLVKAFHRERDLKKYEERQPKIEKDDQYDKLNRMYNNQDSRMDGSSLIGSSSNEIIQFRKNKLKTQPKNQQTSNVQQAHQNSTERRRLNSQTTQKQLIDMLSKPEDFDEEVSLNVTDDLQKSNNKIKVNYEQNNFNVDSGEDDFIEIQQQKQKNPSNKVLRNDMILEQMPSVADKSRSTNFLSTVRDKRRNHANNQSSSSKYSDQLSNSGAAQDYDPIINGPVDPRKRQRPTSNFRQQGIDYESRANRLLSDKRNSISAQLGGRRMPPSTQLPTTKQRKQDPLPQIKRLKSQQSIGSENAYRVNPKKILMQGNRLQFEDDDRYMETEEQQFPTRHLPRILKSQSNLKKQTSKSKLGDKSGAANVAHRQILGGDDYRKQYQRQAKKNQSYKNKMQQIEARLQRNDVSSSKQKKGYREQTHASRQKRKLSGFEKVYKNNNPFDKKY